MRTRRRHRLNTSGRPRCSCRPCGSHSLSWLMTSGSPDWPLLLPPAYAPCHSSSFPAHFEANAIAAVLTCIEITIGSAWPAPLFLSAAVPAASPLHNILPLFLCLLQVFPFLLLLFLFLLLPAQAPLPLISLLMLLFFLLLVLPSLLLFLPFLLLLLSSFYPLSTASLPSSCCLSSFSATFFSCFPSIACYSSFCCPFPSSTTLPSTPLSPSSSYSYLLLLHLPFTVSFRAAHIVATHGGRQAGRQHQAQRTMRRVYFWICAKPPNTDWQV